MYAEGHTNHASAHGHPSSLRCKPSKKKRKRSIACPIHNFFAIKYGARKQRTGGQLKLLLDVTSGSNVRKFLDVTSNVSGCRKGFLDTNKKTNYIARLETARQIY